VNDLADIQREYNAVVASIKMVTIEDGQGHQYTFDIFTQVGYDPSMLTVALSQQPGLVAWWGSVAARIASLLTRAKAEYSRQEARARKAARRGLFMRDAKRPTEKQIEDEVIMCEDVIVAQEVVIEVTEKLAQVKAIERALDHRKGVLLEESARQRREFFTSSSVKGDSD